MGPRIERLSRLAGELADWPVFGLAANLGPAEGVFLVGGALRDALTGRRPEGPLEVDLAVAGPALALGRELARQTGGKAVVLSQADEAIRLILPGLTVDLVGLRRPEITGDLAARDFTINALALKLTDLLAGRPALIDPLGGLGDLAAGRLRLAGPGVLFADPLRVLRGYRLVAELGLDPLPATRQALRVAAPGLGRVAGERINQELSRLLAAPHSAPAMTLMAVDRALYRVCPEVAALSGLYQNRYHHLSGLDHTLAALAEAETLIWQVQPGWPSQEDAMADPRRRLVLKLALLFHDAGKATALRAKADGTLAFPNHAKISARLWRRAATRLRFSRLLTRQVSSLIEAHMRPLSLILAPQCTLRAIRRLAMAGGERLIDLGLLCLADCRATKGPAIDPRAERRLIELWGECLAVQTELARHKVRPIIDGHELMAALGLRPGPVVGQLLAEIAEARLAGRLQDKKGAIALARKKLARLGSKG